MAIKQYDTGLKKIYYKDVSESPADDGDVRLGEDGQILWRNEANTANIGLAKNDSDQLTYNGVVVTTGGATPPGGSDTQVQFNDAGSFGGDAGLTYNKTTDTLTAARFVSTQSTGTAPFSVSSTTKVSNLNADLLDDKNTGTSGNVIPLLDGVNTWSGDQTLSTTTKLQVRDTGIFINSSVDGQLDIDADVEAELTAPTVDINASTGLALDGANLNSSWLVNTNNEIRFRDTASRIYSSATDTLDVQGNVTTNIGKAGTDIGMGDNATNIALKPLFDQMVDVGTSSLRIRNFYLGNDMDILDAGNFILGSTTGTKFGTATTQLLGFWNATPVVRPTAYTQTYSTASKTVANNTSNAVATTGATNVTPYGYTTSAQADAIVTAINALRTDVDNAKKVINQILDDLQSIGLLA